MATYKPLPLALKELESCLDGSTESEDSSPDCFRVEPLDTDDTVPNELKGNDNYNTVAALKCAALESAAFKSAKSISILVTGKTGCGKSSLVNGILGVTLPEESKAEEGSDISKACTTNVTSFNIEKEGVDLTIWDSPGLQDGTDDERYLQQMKEKCNERDLTMYCIKVNDTRFLISKKNQEVVAMTKLTKEFGPKFWTNTVIVLTFSNRIADDVHIRYLKEDEKMKAFKKKLQQWIDQTKKILSENVELDREIIEKIMFVPAGYYCEQHLPSQGFWLSNLWFHCYNSIPSSKAKLALFKANLARLKQKSDVHAEDFEQQIENQPIVGDESHFQTIWKTLGIYIGGAVVGAVIGAGIGAIGGPAGVAIGLPIGAATGTGSVVLGCKLKKKIQTN